MNKYKALFTNNAPLNKRFELFITADNENEAKVFAEFLLEREFQDTEISIIKAQPAVETKVEKSTKTNVISNRKELWVK